LRNGIYYATHSICICIRSEFKIIKNLGIIIKKVFLEGGQMKSQKTMFFLFILCLFVMFAVASPPASAQCVPTGPEGPFGDASCGDWIDNDCDGLTDTADTDCYNYVGGPDTDDDGDGKTENELDCNDGDATIYTGATRICDGKDNNCDGRLDFSADVDNDNDGYAKCVDCADGDPNINPGVVEGGVGSAVCTDGIDNDCDFLIDLAEPGCQDPCIDNDGDGYYSIADSFPACTFPLDDCDDSNAAINPGALDDTCNNIDENCAGGPDDGYIPTPTNCGIGVCASSGLLECQSGVLVDTCLENAPGTEGPAGPPADPTCSDLVDNDCDGLTDGADDDCIPCVPTGLPDDNCDGIDDDCDGTPDDDYVSPPVLPCGIGECVATAPCQCTNGIEDCPVCVPGPPGSEGPLGDPTCIDGLDNDCDGTTDGGDNNCQSSCLDNDGDGYGNPGDTSCTSGSSETDCDDTDDKVYPGATRICDGKDSNCDGRLDFAADVDVDGDTYPACAECNDNNPAINPGVIEGPFGDPSCSDGEDNDCDGFFDIGEPSCQSPCFDEDGDGYYSTASLPACTFPLDDCDDINPAINPGALDDNCNDIDEDCSLVADDGYISTPTNCGLGVCASTGVLNCLAGGILDNTCVAGSPTEVPEVTCSDTADNDCDGLTDGADPDCSLFCVDVDGDGYGVVDHIDCTNAGTDCDDSNAAINPGASDITCNGIDENCAGGPDEGYVPDASCGVGDCFTNNTPSTCISGVETACQPGAPGIEGPQNDPTCSGGADEDCDGLIDGADPNCQTSCVDNDGDGYGNPGDPTCTNGSTADCDDTDPLVYPGATRICDGKDSNCDGRLDFAADVDVDGDTYPACAECNDNNPAINPGATEGPPGDPTCFDGVDNDCDGWFDSGQDACNDPCVDSDGDGFYDVNSDPSCLLPLDDCDDSNAAVNPGAADAICDGIDNNCDGTDDDEYVAPVTNCGLGICATTGLDECIAGVVTDSCAPLPVAVQEGPDGDPTCTDSLDNDCDGQIDISDSDCDPCTTTGLPDDNCDGIDDDCINGPDDLYVAPVTNCGLGICAATGLDECIAGVVVDSCVPLPAGSEGPPGDPTCSGGLDEDCDGLADLNDPSCGAPCPDADGDTYIVCDGVCDELGRACGDCDDTDPLVYPGATRICDGKDNNCDGRLDFGSDVDNDADTYPVCAGDCNDSNPNVNPGVTEGPPADATCSDGLDNDCDGFSDVGDNNGIPNCLSWAGNCTTRTEPKSGPHIFDLMDPGPTGSTSDDTFIRTSCQWCHTDATGTINQQLDCQRCHADWNDPSDPLNGVLKDPSNPIAYPLNPPYGFATAPNVKTHLHDAGSPVTAPHCITCHNPHLQEQDATFGTTYGKMIKEFICYDETRLINRYEEAINFTSKTSSGSFADGPPHNENICEMCHTPTLTNHHANDGSAPADNPGGTYVGHHDGEDCMQCHAHSDGFNASSCSDCHSIPQDKAGVGPVLNSLILMTAVFTLLCCQLTLLPILTFLISAQTAMMRTEHSAWRLRLTRLASVMYRLMWRPVFLVHCSGTSGMGTFALVMKERSVGSTATMT
jgi:hypothetical protein